jgi:hypothetical protein
MGVRLVAPVLLGGGIVHAAHEQGGATEPRHTITPLSGFGEKKVR